MECGRDCILHNAFLSEKDSDGFFLTLLTLTRDLGAAQENFGSTKKTRNTGLLADQEKESEKEDTLLRSTVLATGKTSI